jgi:hypothetical protein
MILEFETTLKSEHIGTTDVPPAFRGDLTKTATIHYGIDMDVRGWGIKSAHFIFRKIEIEIESDFNDEETLKIEVREDNDNGWTIDDCDLTLFDRSGLVSITGIEIDFSKKIIGILG